MEVESILIGGVALAFMVFWSLTPWRRWPRWMPRRPKFGVRIGYTTGMIVVNVFHDLGLLPGVVTWIALGALILALMVTPDDDDDDSPPRRRFRSALKRAKTWLATGMPATTPEGA